MENIIIKNNPEQTDVIELKNVTQIYPNSKGPTIENLSLLIEDAPENGQYITILGPSGCGKSTILRYICGLQKPTSGEILMNGKPISSADRAGMIFQQYSSFEWLTVYENIEFGLKLKGEKESVRKEKVKAIIDVVGLAGHENKYAKYPVLSGGQLQRVAIARSLVANPRILMMDEPFGALDIGTRSSMQDMILSLWGTLHPTIVLVTHDIAEAVYLSDDIYIMSTGPGKIVEHFKIDLGPRNRATKRSPKFNEYVYQIEDKMESLKLIKK
jgi:NitT/TauT family transport system ATP-binding protein